MWRRQNNPQPLICIRVLQELNIQATKHIPILVSFHERINFIVHLVDDFYQFSRLGGQNGFGGEKTEFLLQYAQATVLDACIANLVADCINQPLREAAGSSSR